jgi:hypothetical protein
MSALYEAKEKLQNYLTDFVGSIDLLPDGRLGFEQGSTKLFVRVGENDAKEWRYAIFTAPLALNVPTSPELFKWVALHTGDYIFGHIECIIDNEDAPTATLIYSHTLLLDYLDAEEVRRATSAVVFTADGLDDEVVAKFGGVRYTDS